MIDIITIAILAVIAGAQGWEDIQEYGVNKQEWLQQFLELPEGIPSPDTFRRVFERIKPECTRKMLPGVGAITGREAGGRSSSHRWENT